MRADEHCSKKRQKGSRSSPAAVLQNAFGYQERVAVGQEGREPKRCFEGLLRRRWASAPAVGLRERALRGEHPGAVDAAETPGVGLPAAVQPQDRSLRIHRSILRPRRRARKGVLPQVRPLAVPGHRRVVRPPVPARHPRRVVAQGRVPAPVAVVGRDEGTGEQPSLRVQR